MPPIVASGREAAGIWACGMCHYPNGQGRPENAGVAGLPKAYIVQQLLDFKNGLRQSSDPTKTNSQYMIAYAAAMSSEDIDQAATYFSSMRWRPWIEVVEADTVPKTHVEGGVHLPLEGRNAGKEPIGRRIIEMPKNAEYSEIQRNPRVGWVAYAPVGAIAKLYRNVGWSTRDVDLFEINEAFAVVTMAAMQEHAIPHERVNLHGGACAIGHPIGASGARIVVTLIGALRKQGKRRGVASLCIGGGEATAMAIELA